MPGSGVHMQIDRTSVFFPKCDIYGALPLSLGVHCSLSFPSTLPKEHTETDLVLGLLTALPFFFELKEGSPQPRQDPSPCY